jgi:hypothetical protein
VTVRKLAENIRTAVQLRWGANGNLQASQQQVDCMEELKEVLDLEV